MQDTAEELKTKSALAHRILALTGSSAEISGHVFVRVADSNQMLVRCRNNSDWSPTFVSPEAMHRVDLDGNPAEELGNYLPPPERFIGTEIFKARPEVGCVIHGHPRYQVMCAAAGVEIRPVVGFRAPYGGYGTRLALDGVPVYPRSILIASPEASRGVVAVLGAKNACILKGHGNVVVGRTIEETVVRAIQLENLAKLCWELALLGKPVLDIPPEDVEEEINPTQPAAVEARARQGGVNWVWQYYVKLLEDGSRLPIE